MNRISTILLGTTFIASTYGLWALDFSAPRHQPATDPAPAPDEPLPAAAPVPTRAARPARPAPVAPDESPEPAAERAAPESHEVFVERADTGDGPESSEQPALEQALAEGEPDPVWTAEVDSKVRELLTADPEIEIQEVLCTTTFCSVRMEKPTESALGWGEVDVALSEVATGETIFQAVPNGPRTIAHIYFSATDSSLPLEDNGARDQDGV